MAKVVFAAPDLKQCRRNQEGLALAPTQQGGQPRETAGERLRRHRQLQQEMTKRKWAEENLLLHQEKLRSLRSELALAEERERRRIALEVHDRIGQNLAFAKMRLKTIPSAPSSDEAAKAISDVLKLIDDTIRHTRELVSEIASPALYELGLLPAVELLAQQTQERHGIVVTVSDDGKPKPLSHDLRVLLYQALRELLVNTVKHAQAASADVSIAGNGDHICIKVEDDGRGFDPERTVATAVKRGSYGLFSIKERLQPLGGSLHLDSRPGQGTRAALEAPLENRLQGTGEKQPWA
ncbi:MAG: sensor histidine kinase [Thermodesulfobacteriota bacterium]|nr:sensor histidine kinase [Thermodesulfobacteriota bacterium]